MGLKVLVDICPILRRRTGVGHYIFYLLRELLQDERLDDVVGVCGLRFWSREELLGLTQTQPEAEKAHPEGHHKRFIVAAFKVVLGKVPGSRKVRYWLHDMVLKTKWRHYRDYIFWGGNYVLPRFFLGKTLLTIHDLSHIYYPQFHPVERVRFLTRHLPDAIRRANAITVVSEATRGDLLREFPDIVEASKIFRVSPAVDDHFRKPPDKMFEAFVREKYRLPDKFILSVGTLEPRKNLSMLLEAYMLLTPGQRREWPLLLVGDKGWLSGELAERVRNNAQVRWLGYVADEDMPCIYRQAGIFVYVSLFEGFGMPILEAMTAGAPVIASNRGAMREAAGGGAVLVDPQSSVKIHQSLALLINCPNLREELAVKGAKRSNGESWRARREGFIRALQQVGK